MTADGGTSAPAPKRRYRGRVQAEVAALTRGRIMDAALARTAELWLDQLTLEQVAARAEVAVQTVIRHFGTKERLLEAAGEEAYRRGAQQRADSPAGDITAAARMLVDQYEEVGGRLLRLLAQEERYPALHAVLEVGR